MIHDNKEFLNSPSKLPCYRNIFYISPVSSSTFLFSSCSSSLVYTQYKPISFGSQLVGLDYSADGVVDPKECRSEVERVGNHHNRLWWIGHAIVIWWNFSNGLFSLSTFYWWEWGTCPTLILVCRKTSR